MKGKQLTLEEVLRLEDGTKVWVEELNPRYSDWSGIHKRVLDELIAEKDEMIYEIRYLDGLGEDYGIEIYEWVDASHMLSGFTQQGLTIDDNSIIIGRDCNNIISDMAQEICNLRGLDLNENNIDKIMKEFK